MSVNSKMTAIADATRALDGSTAALTLDGIASKLGTEKTNIAAALAAIAEKGVEVPSGSTSDALAELIASIEAGGGESVWVETGTITYSADTSRPPFPCSKKPDIFIIFNTLSVTATSSANKNDIFVSVGYNDTKSRERYSYIFGCGLNGGGSWLMPYGLIVAFNGDGTIPSGAKGSFRAALSYEWIAIGGVL